MLNECIIITNVDINGKVLVVPLHSGSIRAVKSRYLNGVGMRVRKWGISVGLEDVGPLLTLQNHDSLLKKMIFFW